MCLSELDKKNKLKDDVKYGYKVFQKTPKGLTAELFSFSVYPINQWIDEKDYRLTQKRRTKLKCDSPLEEKYEYGFHCFYEYKDADNWKGCDDREERQLIIRKVEVEDIVAKGWQEFNRPMPVFVAKKIKILEEGR